MDLGTVQSVAQSLFDALQSSELKELCSVWGYESQLEELERTISVVKAVLLDAGSKEVQANLSHQAQLWVDELKYVVFDADDLLDKFVTIAEQKQLMDMDGGNVFKKVRRFFSLSNSLIVAVNMSRGVKDIRNRLDAIANDHGQFGFKLDCDPTRRRRDESCSYIYAKNIIGREQDKENIISMLLDPNNRRPISFLTIVGIGGLGKTALAQLVYNDPRVEQNFPLRLWTCVAGEDQRHLDVKSILVKLLQAATRQNHLGFAVNSLEELREELQMYLVKNRYLIVLDDVWNEDRYQWGKLVQFFLSGLSGSWILMTSRSKITAEVVGDGVPYELTGLSEEDSWHLFQMTAFEQGLGPETHPPDLIKIGQEIVKKCANVPLAIKVTGSLLYGQRIEKWQSIQEVGIGRLRQGEDGIEPILKFSYLHLETSLRICFSYCAMFPKDYVIEKDMLISLWMAQGYIVPLEEGQSIEDAGEEHYSILLKRCFFEDLRRDEYGNIVSCKMHDLMHDIAQQVAGKEIYTSSSVKSNSDRKIRHVSRQDIGKGQLSSFARSKIRSYLRFTPDLLTAPDLLIANWTCLRALDLSDSMFINLAGAMGNLLHLRYLDLSRNYWLEALPKSILELHNLQTLKLRECFRLKLPKALSKFVKLRFLDLNGLNISHLPDGMDKLSHLAHLDLSMNMSLLELPDSLMELSDLRTLRLSCCDRLRVLPTDMSKLVKLRIFDITGCWLLDNMPHGIGNLSCLRTLPLFVVSEKSHRLNTHMVDMLEELKALMNLNGHLEIRFNISENATYVKKSGREGGYLRNKQHLEHIIINFNGDGASKKIADYEEALLEDLQPHPNLKGLQLSGYCGKLLPGWAREYCLPAVIPNLVKLHLVSCDGLQSLSSLGKLCCLKSLIVEQLNDLEYIENTSQDAGALDSRSGQFFPSLEILKLEDLPNLRIWWRNHRRNSRYGKQQEVRLLSFPRLVELRIWGCPHLTCIPLCPTVERLILGKSSTRLRIMKHETANSTLRSVYTEDVGCLKSALSVESFECLAEMEIKDDRYVRRLSDVRGLFKRCSLSLKSLIIDGCPKLRDICSGLVDLTALETLHIRNIPCTMREWTCPSWGIQSLSLECLPNIDSLPCEMENMIALKFLSIKDCEGLESLPEFFNRLNSLENLEITGCSLALKKRCQKTTGEDWPKIADISHVLITSTVFDSSSISTSDASDFSIDNNDSDFSSDNSSVHCL